MEYYGLIKANKIQTETGITYTIKDNNNSPLKVSFIPQMDFPKIYGIKNSATLNKVAQEAFDTDLSLMEKILHSSKNESVKIQYNGLNKEILQYVKFLYDNLKDTSINTKLESSIPTKVQVIKQPTSNIKYYYLEKNDKEASNDEEVSNDIFIKNL